MQNQSFDKECKVQAVKLFLEQKKSVSQAARELGIAKSTLHRWVTEYQVDDQHAFRGKGQLHPEQKEIQELQKEIRDLREENAILKKAMVIFTKSRS